MTAWTFERALVVYEETGDMSALQAYFDARAKRARGAPPEPWRDADSMLLDELVAEYVRQLEIAKALPTVEGQRPRREIAADATRLAPRFARLRLSPSSVLRAVTAYNKQRRA